MVDPICEVRTSAEISPLPRSSANDIGYKGSMRKLIASIHNTANDILAGPPADETNFMVWAQAGIEDSL